MKLKRQFLIGLLMCALLAPISTFAVPKGERNVRVNFKETKLKNGLRVITVEDHTLPMAETRLSRKNDRSGGPAGMMNP